MRAAGLNPALAYQQGGASAPSGSMAQQENIGEEAVGTAMAVKLQTEQFKLLQEQRKKTTLEGLKVGSEANITRYNEEMARGRRNLYFDISGRPRPMLGELVRAEHGAVLGSSAKSISDAQLSTYSQAEMKAISELFEQVGESGAGAARFLPLIIQLLGARR